MPTLRAIVKQMVSIESQSDDEPGAYPVMFKDDWTKVKFILLLKFYKVRNMFASLPQHIFRKITNNR